MSPKTQELVLHLPEDVLELVRHTAAEQFKTPDQLIAEELRFVLQPMHQEAMQRLKNYIQRQQKQTDGEIRKHLDAHLTNKEQQRLSQLLEQNRAEGLTETEQA